MTGQLECTSIYLANTNQPDVLEDVFWLLPTAAAVRSNGNLDLVADITERYDSTVNRL